MPGLNDDISYKGIAYMVQTQDLGLHSRGIETTIYKKGELLLRRRFDYSHLLAQADFPMVLKNKLESMHRTALSDVESGKFSSPA